MTALLTRWPKNGYNLKAMSPPEPWEITDFQIAAGSHPLRAFLSRLTEDEKGTAIALIQLLGERGNTLRRPHSGSLGNALFELRDVSSGIRVFYTFLGGRQAVLLGGARQETGRHTGEQTQGGTRTLCCRPSP